MHVCLHKQEEAKKFGMLLHKKKVAAIYIYMLKTEQTRLHKHHAPLSGLRLNNQGLSQSAPVQKKDMSSYSSIFLTTARAL